MCYTCTPGEAMGRRIGELRLAGKPVEAGKTYRVAGWAPVAESARDSGLKPVWELIEPWLKSTRRIGQRRVNTPRLVGTAGNAGLM